MNTKGNNSDDVAERIAEAILAEDVFSKKHMIPKIAAIIRAWIRENDKPADYNNIKTDKGLLVKTVEKKTLEVIFWRQQLRDLIGEEKMKPYYDNIQEELTKKGY